MEANARAPRAQAKQAKRARIHQAAQTLFLQHGFEATSMDEIALAAGVSKPTLYRYHQNKEALLVAVLEQLAVGHLTEGPLLALRDQPIASLSELEQALTRWAQETLQHLLHPAYLGLLRLFIAELPRIPHLGSLYTRAIPQQGAVFLGELLEKAQHHGVIVEGDLEGVTRLLAGSLLTYVGNGLLTADEVPQTPPSERLAALVRLVLRAIAA
jgi:TetR/AcrR family transcriptional repressor of mexJK operon